MIAALLIVSAAVATQQAGISVSDGSGVAPARVEAVRRLTAEAVADLAPVLGVVARPFAVVVHADRTSLPDDVRRSLHEGTAGVALLERQEIHLMLDEARTQPPHDLRTVVRHEVVHLLLHQLAGAAGRHLPRWLHEGLAQELSGSTYLGASEEDIVLDAQVGGLPRLAELRDRFPGGPTALRSAYAQSFSFVSFLSRRLGLPALLDVVRACGPDRPFEEAFQRVTGVRLVILEEEWLEYVKTSSGAAWRVLLTSCFGLTMVALLPLLVLAGKRRWARDLRSREKLELQEREDQGPDG